MLRVDRVKKRMNYRKEIDGLRAIAVLPVIMFHAGFGYFKGGFVGVDIFFVISGYLIATIIILEKKAGEFSFTGFYERRARRILPALFLVMAICLPFAWLWLLPAEMEKFSASIVAVILFVSNFYFKNQVGYFDGDAELKPLLHTWSLAVEEQYYFIFPIFIIIAWKLHWRYIAGLISLAIIVSIVFAQKTVNDHPAAAFFLLPARIWELLAGAILGVFLSFNSNWQPRKLESELFGILGILLVLYAVVFYDSRTPFPGFHALAPTFGAALIILFASPSTGVGRLLGNKVLVSIGVISYSAYLWHQPLLAFARHRSIDEPSGLFIGSMVIGSLVLAHLSWRYVEMPVRDRKRFSRKNVFLSSAIGGLVFLCIGIVGYYNEGFPHRLATEARFLDVKTVQESKCHTSLRRTEQQIMSGDLCVLGASVPPSVAVIGDSHAGAIFDELEKNAIKEGFSFLAISGGWCVPILNGFNTRSNAGRDSDCVGTTRAAFDRVLEDSDINDVVLVAEWANYTRGNRNNDAPRLYEDLIGAAKTPLDNAILFDRSLKLTVDRMANAGKNIFIVEPTPEFNRPVLAQMQKVFLVKGVSDRSKISDYSPKISFFEYAERNREVFSAFQSIRNVNYISVKEIFCSVLECISATPGGDLLFSDTNHVTNYGAVLIANKITETIKYGSDKK